MYLLNQEEELLEYLTVKSAYQCKAIPGRNKFTFLSKLTGIPQIWTMDDNQQPVRYVELDDRPISVHHSPIGGYSVIGMDRKGDEKQQLYLYQEETSELEHLVTSPNHFHYPGGWSPDGTSFSFSIFATNCSASLTGTRVSFLP